MKIISPSVELLGYSKLIDDNSEESPMKLLELAIRNCYKSEDKITEDSWQKIIKIILDNNHTSTLEHVSFTFRIITSRDILQEIARHRIASYSVESSRYVNYGNSKKGLTFIRPAWVSQEQLDKAISLLDTFSDSSKVLYAVNDPFITDDIKAICNWYMDLQQAEFSYNFKLDKGWKPQQARISLPGCTKTEIVMTMNIRSLLNFLQLRTSPQAHPDMQVVAKLMQQILQEKYPGIFTNQKEQDKENEKV